jgi:hypothetical protein
MPECVKAKAPRKEDGGIAKLDRRTQHSDDRTKEQRKQETGIGPHTTHRPGLHRHIKNISIVL